MFIILSEQGSVVYFYKHLFQYLRWNYVKYLLKNIKRETLKVTTTTFLFEFPKMSQDQEQEHWLHYNSPELTGPRASHQETRCKISPIDVSRLCFFSDHIK